MSVSININSLTIKDMRRYGSAFRLFFYDLWLFLFLKEMFLKNQN